MTQADGANRITPGRSIAILGSTGSIGTSTLDVIRALGTGYRVTALCAGSQGELLRKQAEEFRPRWMVLGDPQATPCTPPSGTEFLCGAEAIERVAAAQEVDTVVAAIVGAAGLRGTWSAVQSGKRIALANKETLVMAGPLVMREAAIQGAEILPVDSEHSAVFQAMQSGRRAEVKRVVLTASGGPFRQFNREKLQHVTPEQALAHPTWNMGRKITIDSATLMNKSLELIEAKWLYDLRPDQLQVVIHPQSVVHSFVEFVDGSVLAQLSPPDMKLPIQYALTYPDRVPGISPVMNWGEFFRLEFFPPDCSQFPALELGMEVVRTGGTSGAVLNAANEVAVQRFLSGEMPFLDIPRACQAVLHAHNHEPLPDLNTLFKLDRWAREELWKWKR